MGIIYDWQKNKRYIAFDGLQFGMNRPSDVDGLMILPDKTIVIEYKCGMVGLKPIQRWVLKTLVDDAQTAGKKSIAIIARYFDRDPRNVVDASSCLVTETYINGRWYEVSKCKYTLRQTMERFLTERS